MDNKHCKIKEAAQKELAGSAHDMDHIMRVHNIALHLAKGETDIDMEILVPAVLLHDIGRVREDKDATGGTDHAELGSQMAQTVLLSLEYSKDQIASIQHCILSHRFRNSYKNRPKTREAKTLFDADKLDVLGAVGIARAFIIAGEYGERIHSDVALEDYIRDNLVGAVPDGMIKQIQNHTPFYEYQLKFRHIEKKLFSPKAKLIARKRLAFMDQFFSNLEREIAGQL